MRQSYTEIALGQVHYQTEGTGAPLLLLHQTRMSSDEYSDVIPILAEKYQVIAMDMLGHGHSAKATPGFTIENHARTVVDFMASLGIRRASIVGHHVGSRVAVEVAVTYPDRVDKLILSGCAWYTPEERRMLRNDPKYRPLEIKDDGAFLLDLWQRNRSAFVSQVPPDMVCKVTAISLLSVATGYNIHEAVFSHDIDKSLRLLKCPTLLVSGSKDVFYAKLDIIARLIPRCRTRVIPEGGYFVCLEKPREFSDVICSFIEDPKV